MSDSTKAGVGNKCKKVKVIHNYSYFSKSDQKDLNFKTGEEYYLLSETSENWWFVKKNLGDATGIYVPAVYVAEITAPRKKELVPPASAPVTRVKPELKILPKPAKSREIVAKPSLSDGAIDELNGILRGLEAPEEFKDFNEKSEKFSKPEENDKVFDEPKQADDKATSPFVYIPTTPFPDPQMTPKEESPISNPVVEERAEILPREEGKVESETSDYKTDSRESLDSEDRVLETEARTEADLKKVDVNVDLKEETSFAYHQDAQSRLSTSGKNVEDIQDMMSGQICEEELKSPVDNMDDYANLKDIQEIIQQNTLRSRTLLNRGPPLAVNLLPHGYINPYQVQTPYSPPVDKKDPLLQTEVPSTPPPPPIQQQLPLLQQQLPLLQQPPSEPVVTESGSTSHTLSDDPDESLSSPTSNILGPKMVEKQGLLQKARVEENSKKMKKGWSNSYVVLCQNLLYFYKEVKPSAAAKPRSVSSLGKPEFIVDLKDTKVTSAPEDKNVKKDAFMLITTTKTHYLLHHEDDDNNLHWRQSIENNIAVLAMGVIPAATPFLNRDKPDASSSDVIESKQTIANRLKNFLLRRPTKESIKLKGIYKEVIFGSSLISICEKEKGKVPRFVKECLLAIETRGLTVDGLYRVNGTMAVVQKLRNMVDQNQLYDLNQPSWDIHTITGALKLFFRELSEPLFTFKLYKSFLTSLNNLSAVKDIIRQLPPQHSKTMKLVFRHFAMVLQHSRENRMQVQGLAIVFGPTLLWSENTPKDTNLAFDLIQQGQLVEFMINNCKSIFG